MDNEYHIKYHFDGHTCVEVRDGRVVISADGGRFITIDFNSKFQPYLREEHD